MPEGQPPPISPARLETRQFKPQTITSHDLVQVGIGKPKPPEQAPIPMNVAEMKNELTDSRVITKKHDPEGRFEAAQKVWKARQNKQKLDKLTESEAKLNEQLESRRNTLLVKLKGVVRLEDHQVNELQTKLGEIRQEKGGLEDKPTAREILDAYYEEAKTKPLTNEEKRDLLKPDVVASLSDEEYITLWKRLNPYFLAHVTRQGFRDHNAMMSHAGGLEKYHNGFIGTMEDGGLIRTPYSVDGLDITNKESVKRVLQGWVLNAANEEEANDRLHRLFNVNMASAPPFPDKTSVHFTAQLVANQFYGGEKDNEIFFVFPTDVIASQHDFAFNGDEKDFTQPQSETKWNDIFVWPNDQAQPGIAVDTGMVFLPESTPVDPETGSKYASEVKEVDDQEQRVLVENTQLIDTVISWGSEPQVQAAFQKYRGSSNGPMTIYEQTREFERQLQEKGLTHQESYDIVRNYMVQLELTQELNTDVFRSAVAKSELQWKRAENAIPAKEYWENFFAKNPQLRPKHIQYYSGVPTAAVYAFQQENGIGGANTATAEGTLLGFDDKHIIDMRTDSRANKGYEEVIRIGKKIISEHYSS